MEGNQSVGVVLLEDHAVVMEGLSALLQRSGIEVLGHAGDLETFLQLVAERHPLVAVIDVVIESPDGSRNEQGLAALAQLASRHPEVRPLVLSGYRSEELVTRCYQAGAAGFLCKLETSGETLIDAIRVLAGGGRLQPDGHPTHAREPRSGFSRLTPRERDVLTHLATGADNLTIAACLGISERTVKAHISSLYRKLGSENRLQLALFARQVGYGVRA